MYYRVKKILKVLCILKQKKLGFLIFFFNFVKKCCFCWLNTSLKTKEEFSAHFRTVSRLLNTTNDWFYKENIRRVFLVILLIQLFYEVYLHNQKKSRIFKKFGNLKVLSYFRIHLFRQNMENFSFFLVMCIHGEIQIY